MSAGVAATDTFYGDANDVKLSGAGVRDQANHFSKIASITIAGQVLGTAAAGDNFGFVAQQIGSVQVGGTVIPLTPASGKSRRMWPSKSSPRHSATLSDPSGTASTLGTG